MKKFNHLLILLVVVTLITIPIISFAAELNIDGIVNDVKSQDPADLTVLEEAGGQIYATIQTAGIIISLIIVVVFGVQWLVATPAKKAELKGKMWNIVIGIAIILLASTIVSQVGKMIQGFDSPTSSSNGGSNNSGNSNNGSNNGAPIKPDGVL